jgi:hypothetical protein
MNRFALAACTVTAVLAAPAVGSAQSPIEGAWAFTLQSPEGTFDIPLTITREADGLVARVPTGQVFFTGAETTSGVEFFWPLVYQDMDLPTTLVGSFRNGEWVGTADFAGMAQGSWVARRAAAPASPGQ